MAIRITLECGHVSMLRPRTTLEGYTHDWEVFVRGVDNADISQYVEKVVFQLHETFPKPKRTLKDAPYVLKESGYAGFVLPIYIYLKNKDEPKKIEISYDLTLAPSGPAITNVMRHSEVITNPPDDFKRKLLKGGGVSVPTSNEAHDKSESKVSPQMSGKPKLSGAEAKKHRPMEPRSTNQFAHLFGVPIKTGNKVSPEAKKIQDKTNHHKTPPEKSEKVEKSSKSKSSPHKDPKKDKTEDNKKDKKDKDASKDKDRSKDKVKRPQSPPKPDYQSPVPKRPQSPASKKQLSPHDSNIQKSSSPKIREKDHKKSVIDREKHTEKPVKPPEDVKVDKKKKKHKDDKESERKEKNREKNKEKSKDPKPVEKKAEKHEKPEKQEKEKLQENRPQKDVKKSPKPSKDGERSSSKSRPEVDKPKEQKVDKERQKHKHRKKDKKERSDDSREREKRDKKDKQKSYDKDGAPAVPASNPLSTLLAEVQDRDSSDSNSGDEEEHKPVISVKNDPESSRLVPEVRLTRPVSPSGSSGKVKSEKVKREKSKPRSDDKDNRKRKRRSDSKGDDDVPAKREKDPAFSPPLEPVSSSQSPVAAEMAANYSSNVKEQDDLHSKEAFETEQIAPDSTNNMLVESEGDEPLVFSEDYVSQLKDLQQKIMTLQDNQELQRVVQVIAATGQYEITRKTFDFDLCALDRRTVQRLQEFFSAS
ncbi:protein ENL-like [Diachasma alloeum]|uniref:protein ENL-like n=1 Tax=Diachasma alloeum TaxID=454923 RepID=UPI0007381943|nr:protein ENL-like [Diachasma alloeum]